MTENHPFKGYKLVEEFFYGDYYEWSCVAVFRRRSDGELFWGADSGCSCNRKWESLSPADLDPFNPETLHAFMEAALDVGYDRVKAHLYVVRMTKLIV